MPVTLPCSPAPRNDSGTNRREGSGERVRVPEVDGRAALVLSENPRPPLKAPRRIGLLASAPNGMRDIGNMRISVLADGRRVVYPQGGGIKVGGVGRGWGQGREVGRSTAGPPAPTFRVSNQTAQPAHQA